jgi:hypothetical protein
LELIAPMKKIQRASRDVRRITRSLAAAATTTLKGNELALASGRVIARRTALGVAALFDPASTDHVEFSRMVSEKMAAFSTVSSVVRQRSTAIIAQMMSVAARETTIALSAASEIAASRTPADMVAAQSRFILGWFERALSQSLVLGSLATSAGSAMLAPVHRAATGNAKRLHR